MVLLHLKHKKSSSPLITDQWSCSKAWQQVGRFKPAAFSYSRFCNLVERDLCFLSLPELHWLLRTMLTEQTCLQSDVTSEEDCWLTSGASGVPQTLKSPNFTGETNTTYFYFYWSHMVPISSFVLIYKTLESHSDLISYARLCFYGCTWI